MERLRVVDWGMRGDADNRRRNVELEEEMDQVREGCTNGEMAERITIGGTTGLCHNLKSSECQINKHTLLKKRKDIRAEKYERKKLERKTVIKWKCVRG